MNKQGTDINWFIIGGLILFMLIIILVITQKRDNLPIPELGDPPPVERVK